MADSIYKWSLTAGSNDAADSLVNWRENQLPSTVNDSARAMMQRVAEFREDLVGSLVTAGTQPAYTLTSNSQFDTLANGRLITARIHAANTGPATLNVNGLGAKAIRKLSGTSDIGLGSGDLQLNGIYTLMYSAAANAAAGAWIVNSGVTTADAPADGKSYVRRNGAWAAVDLPFTFDGATGDVLLTIGGVNVVRIKTTGLILTKSDIEVFSTST